MKKIVSLAVLGALTATVADAAPSYIRRTQDGNYNVTYDYNDKAKTGWYVGGRASLSLVNWENEYSTEAPNALELDDKESFTEVVFGGGAFVGRTFNYFWRAELEGGLIGQYEHDDVGTTFKLTVPYLMANGYYDFANGLYVGAGLGLALPKVSWQGAFFYGGDDTERSVSPMLGLMAGYSYRLDYNLTLDLRYRLAMLWGPDHERSFVYAYDNGEYGIRNEIGLILDNSFSLGVRYQF